VVVHVDQPGEQGRGDVLRVGHVRPTRSCGLGCGADPGDRVALDDDDAVLDHGVRRHHATAEVCRGPVLGHRDVLPDSASGWSSKVARMVW